jgi:putative ABC transport system permease protein
VSGTRAIVALGQALLEKRQGARRARTSLWVTAREAFWIAVEALRAHKLRSFLTLLGVVISTTTLIVVMSIVNGMNSYIADHVANMGANVFILHQFNWATDEEEWLRERRRNLPMRIDDYGFIKDNLRGYKNLGATSWMRNPPPVRYQGHTIDDNDFEGVTPSMINIGRQEVGYGRYFNDSDFEHSAQVCFIGQDVADQFFSNVDPLGKEIMVGGAPYRVIGVAKRIGTAFGHSQDNFINVPLTAFAKDFMARPQLAINIQAWSGSQMPELEDEVRALMRARRHLPYKDPDNFGINASDTIMAAWHDLTGKLFAVGIGIVAVFMVVGGIVIMNIMLAAVTERTHEIGVRKSLGARRRDILWQFVIESGVMAATGGVIGILLAATISWLVNIVFTSSMPLSAILVGITLSTAAGLFFGIYPAWKAAQLDPIEALRTEA